MIRLGLIGDPVSHSRSPELHMAAFSAAGIRGQYLCHRMTHASVEAGVSALWSQGYQGLNVTLPLKVAATKLCDSVSGIAARAGAINTLHRRVDGSVHGTNTDVDGAVGSLRAAGFTLMDAQVLIVGAGGAARALAVGLLDAGAQRVTLANRTASRAELLVKELNESRLDMLPLESDALRRICPSLVVNATTVGLGYLEPPSEAAVQWFQTLPFHVWGPVFGYDLMYSRCRHAGIAGWTPFLHVVGANGGSTLDGWDMLRRQAALSFALWTDTDMESAYRAMSGVSR